MQRPLATFIILLIGNLVLAQVGLFPHHPYEVFKEIQGKNLENKKVNCVISINTTRLGDSKEVLKNIEKSFLDNEGRDTLILLDDIPDRRIIYDSASRKKIVIHFNKNGECYRIDTLAIDSVFRKLLYRNPMKYSYDKKGRLVWVCMELDTTPVKPSPLDKLFGGQPKIDSIHFYYNIRNQLVRETFIVQDKNYQEATFSYNTKGVIRKLKYGNFTSNISYLYRKLLARTNKTL